MDGKFVEADKTGGSYKFNLIEPTCDEDSTTAFAVHTHPDTDNLIFSPTQLM